MKLLKEILFSTLLLTCATVGAQSFTIGETNVLASTDSGNANLLLAQQASLSQSAMIKSLSFYVAAPSGNLVLGIYDSTGSGGGPGALKAHTNSFTAVSGWNTQPVTSQVILPAGTYWLAYLPSSNSLTFRKTYSGQYKMRSFAFGSMPGSFGTPASADAVHWSFYATFDTATATSPKPVVTLSRSSITFAGQTVGTTSAPQTFTVTNTGNANLIMYTNNTVSGDFTFGGIGTCGTSLAPGASCTYSSKFTPTAAGTRTGQEVIYNNAANSPQSVTLIGTGLTSTTNPTPTPAPISSVGPAPGANDTILFSDDFESGNLSKWDEFWGDSRYSVNSDPTFVKSGSRSLKILHAPNIRGDMRKWFMPGKNEIYIKFDVLYPTGFKLLSTEGQNGMHFTLLLGNNINNKHSAWDDRVALQWPNGSNYFITNVDPMGGPSGGTSILPYFLYTYWPDSNASGLWGLPFYQTSPAIPTAVGRWQNVVQHIKLNTPGFHDGSQSLFIDGVKKVEVLNMRWRDTTDLRANELDISAYQEGGSAYTEYQYMDNIIIWAPAGAGN